MNGEGRPGRSGGAVAGYGWGFAQLTVAARDGAGAEAVEYGSNTSRKAWMAGAIEIGGNITVSWHLW